MSWHITLECCEQKAKKSPHFRGRKWKEPLFISKSNSFKLEIKNIFTKFHCFPDDIRVARVIEHIEGYIFVKYDCSCTLYYLWIIEFCSNQNNCHAITLFLLRRTIRYSWDDCLLLTLILSDSSGSKSVPRIHHLSFTIIIVILNSIGWSYDTSKNEENMWIDLCFSQCNQDRR